MKEQITEWLDKALTLTWANTAKVWLLDHGVKILIIIVCVWLLNRIFKRIIEDSVHFYVISDDSETSEGKKKREDTLIRIFTGAFKITVIVIASIMVLSEMGLEVAPILAGAGIVGLAVGFGGQYLIKDIFSGLFIILENQYRVGDVVNFDGTGGFVEDISLRKTTLRDLDGTVHHISHGSINRVANLSKKFSRVNLNIRVSYNSDLEHVIKVVNMTGLELAEDPSWSEFIMTPPQFLRVDDFADSAIIIKIVGDTKPIKQWDVTGELRKRLKIAFDKEGIEIPFPQVVVHSAKDSSK
jgi:moderate conductance mechanosensitive channel